MEKSPERLALEDNIRSCSDHAYSSAIQELKNAGIYPEDLGEADEEVIQGIQARVADVWNRYREYYYTLETLEEREKFPAMREYALHIDRVTGVIPKECREYLDYPFSGVDFAWARNFKRAVFQDINFGREFIMKNAWWDEATYSPERRDNIVSLMESLVIIHPGRVIVSVGGDANIPDSPRQLNKPDSTLLIRAGHDVLSFVEAVFVDQKMEYGALIFDNPHNSSEVLNKVLAEHSYELTAKFDKPGFIPPFAIEPGETFVYRKK